MNRIKRWGLGSVIKAITCCTILIFIFGAFSCEKEEGVLRQEIKKNSPPDILSVTLFPKKPNKNRNLDTVVQSQDPDGDPVTYYYQWMKNGEEIIGETKNSLNTGSFRKGDLIQVKVTPSDGKVYGKPFLSDPVKIFNIFPIIQEVWIEPKLAYVNESLRVRVKGFDADDDAILYSYQWEKNGGVLSDEGAEVLEKGRFKKGDSIAAIVTANDREDQGSSKRSEPIMILNGPPIIISSPPTSAEGNDYVYQVKAYDPDDDPISFDVKSAPNGMEIGKETGLLRWSIHGQDKGIHSIEIEASDQEGAKCFQRFDLNVEIR